MLKFREIDLKFADISRVFISGSSSAGKTHFARQLFEHKYIQPERIYYYHPDIQEHFPVDWDQYLDIPICFESGIPTETDLFITFAGHFNDCAEFLVILQNYGFPTFTVTYTLWL